MPKRIIKIFSDGGARGNPGPAASAFVVIEGGKTVYKEKKYLGNATNNVAEYTAILMAINWLVDNHNDKNVIVYHFLDSELATNQLTGKYKVKSKNIIPLFLSINKKLKDFSGSVNYISVRRENNKVSDALVNEALDENS